VPYIIADAAWAFAAWSSCGVALVAVACWWLYQDLHAAAVEFWP
jgi:hypothetical protein